MTLAMSGNIKNGYNINKKHASPMIYFKVK